VGVTTNITDNSDEVILRMGYATITGLNVIGAVAETYAKADCPVDTGRLRNSISHAVEDNEAVIGSDCEYASFVELGTRKMKAQPYLRPAAYNHTEEYRKILEDSLRNA